MSSLGVPTPFRPALRSLEQLDEEHASRLIDAFSSAPAFQPLGRLRALARDVLPQEQAAIADRLIPALLSLGGQLRGTPPEQVADAVAGSADLELAPRARTRLRERVLALLSTPAVSTTASAVELLTQHERNYQTARVFTDIRPIFQQNVADPPTGAVIVEMLQIQTWDREGEAETLYVAMDESDLLELRDVVDRALKKTVTLRRFLAEQQMAYFELDKREL